MELGTPPTPLLLKVGGLDFVLVHESSRVLLGACLWCRLLAQGGGPFQLRNGIGVLDGVVPRISGGSAFTTTIVVQLVPERHGFP